MGVRKKGLREKTEPPAPSDVFLPPSPSFNYRGVNFMSGHKYYRQSIRLRTERITDTEHFVWLAAAIDSAWYTRTGSVQ